MKSRMPILLAGAVLVALCGTANAHGRINVGIDLAVPAYTYVVPPPVYYYAPPRIHYAPRPVYYALPPVYYTPAPWAVRHHRHWNKHWDRRHW